MGDPAVRDAIVQVYERRMSELSDRLASGEIDLGEWQVTMRQELRDSFALQIRAGNDGPITNPNDYLKLGSTLKSQYGYLEDFAHAVRDGSVSGGAIASRAKLYARASKQIYWNQATGEDDLPAYPGDGSTPCGTNCGCAWVPRGGKWYWERHKDDSCTTCVQREQDWNPWQPSDSGQELEQAA